MQKGLDASRLDAIGYGQDKPVADNSTPEGRAANRRVELKLSQQ
jgi:outer membrane protein OmpA-like peptidoglycan-associated protein